MTARDAALARLAEIPSSAPAQVVYRSRGAVLVAGPAATGLDVARRLAGRLRVVAVLEDLPAGTSAPPGGVLLPGRVVALEGHLGAFAARAAGPDGPLDLAPLSPNPDGHFDLVVDLGAVPLVDREVRPFGYLAGTSGDDPAALAGRAAGWVGIFHKPRYIAYDPGRCVHRRRGMDGCQRCLTACPAGAIRPGEETVAVDVHLCQGCGGCGAVCPTGALTYAAPAPGETRARLRGLLEAFRQAGGEGGRVLLHERGANQQAVAERLECEPDLLPYAVHSFAALGAETLLAPLAYGAGAVELFPTPAAPAASRAVLAGQLEVARRVLAAAGRDPEAIGPGRRAAAPAAPASGTRPTLAPGASRRSVLAAMASALSGEGLETDLPAAAAHGTVAVNSAACTLCLACTGLCPTGALRRGAGGRLDFAESACVQCGLCVAGCPEDALGLVPRLSLGAQAEAPRTLHRGEMACCDECGKPFMPATLLASALARVDASSTLASEAGALLRLCPSCRARHAMRAQVLDAPRRGC